MIKILFSLIWAYVAGCVGFIVAELLINNLDMDLFMPIAKSSLYWGKYLVEAFKTKTFFSNTPVLVATICAVVSFGSNLNRNRPRS